MNIRLSYIIISWNGLHLLQQLLSSMQKQLARDDVEVWIVDNGSTDETLNFVRNHYPDIHLIRLNENKGVAYARNRALEKAHGDYLLILDNDIVVSDEAIAGMEQYMDAHPQTGLCACRLTGKDGKVQESCKDYPGLGSKIKSLWFGNRPRPFRYADEIQAGEPFEPVYVIGACQMIRRKALEEVGLLDENIFYGPEDCDYCLRMQQAGWKVMYLPKYALQHLCQRKTTRHPFSALGRKHIRALMYFYRKYRRI